jgi:hypothetical protein
MNLFCGSQGVDVMFPNEETVDGYLRWRLHKPIDAVTFERIADRATDICTRLFKYGFIVFSFNITSDAIIIGNGSTAVLSLFPGNLSQVPGNTMSILDKFAVVPMFNSELSHSIVVAAVLFLAKLEMAEEGHHLEVMAEGCEPACVAGWSLVREAVDGLDDKDWRELMSQV